MIFPLLVATLATPTYDAWGITTGGTLDRIESQTGASASARNCGVGEVYSLARDRNGALWTCAEGSSGATRLLAIDALDGSSQTVVSLALGGTMHGFAFEVAGSLLSVLRPSAGGTDPSRVAGVKVNAQWWTRDAAAPSTTNLSNAIGFDVAP